jgi:hypothetical protein
VGVSIPMRDRQHYAVFSIAVHALTYSSSSLCAIVFSSFDAYIRVSWRYTGGGEIPCWAILRVLRP